MRRVPRASFIELSLIAAVAVPAAGQVLLNECVSCNVDQVWDEDWDTPDWIELFNAGPADVNLDGFGLSDDPGDPFKWVFGEASLPADGHLLVFASGKDRHPESMHWETVIDWGDVWRYRVNLDAPPEGWRELSFDAAGWDEGPTGIGYGDGDDATEVPPCISVSLRRTFTVADPSAVRSIILHVDYDDAFVAWLNGAEIVRDNIWSDGPPPWDQPAADWREALIYQGGDPETFIMNWAIGLLRAGPNVLAIQVHNVDVGSSDMSLIPFFTLGMDEPPPGGGDGMAELIRDLIPHAHTNFQLSAEGETIVLHNAQGGLVDQVATGRMYANISRGRSPDGAPDWVFFAEPTPEAPNGESGFAEFAEPPVFSVEGGLYAAPLSLELSAPSPEADITYTTGGVEPDENSTLYTTPLSITETQVIRARAFEAGKLPSLTVTHSYIFDDPRRLPVTSFVTDPPNLWDEETGIYVGDNIWRDWERPMHVEFFETDGATGLSQDAGVKLYGAWTRTYPQKSFRLIARAGYGTPSFDYPIFDEKPITSFTELIWRNAGNDWCQGHVRDPLIHRLMAHTGIDRQAYRPSRVYLNGEYWGILNVRERIDADYLSANHGVNPDSVDLIKLYYEVVEGSSDHYMAMLDYIETHDLADSADYAYIRTQMDTDEFADYQIFQIHYANVDWPGNNIAYWRPQTPDGRWRWVVHDTDFGLGLVGGYDWNTLAMALDPDGDDWPNPPYATFLLRSLMENETFRHTFINRYCDHLNSSFLSERTLAVTDAIAGGIEAEIPAHMTRWGFSPSVWENHMSVVREFLSLRPDFARTHLREILGLGGDWVLSLDVSPPGAGRIRLAAVEIDSAWSGTYFLGVPLTLTAMAEPGYVFREWSDPELPDEPLVVLAPDGDVALIAFFEESALPATAVINEINYHSADGFDPGDWIEIHNPGGLTLEMGGWTLKDENDAHSFVLPAGVDLLPGGFIVLCQDTTAFAALFPGVGPILGNLSFGFSADGELLRLYDAHSALYDWVEYDDAPPWPPEPDGQGPTLELIDPALDNTLASSWEASSGHGTPGSANDAALFVDTRPAPPLALLRPFPNPFNPRTEIRFSLDRPRNLALTIYDVAGRRVRVLASGRFEPGAHQVAWSGRDDRGHTMPSGVYLLRMDSEGYRSAMKLVLVR